MAFPSEKALIPLTLRSKARKKVIAHQHQCAQKTKYVVAMQSSGLSVADEIFFSRFSILAAWLLPSKCCHVMEAITRIDVTWVSAIKAVTEGFIDKCDAKIQVGLSLERKW